MCAQARDPLEALATVHQQLAHLFPGLYFMYYVLLELKMFLELGGGGL